MRTWQSHDIWIWNFKQLFSQIRGLVELKLADTTLFILRLLFLEQKLKMWEVWVFADLPYLFISFLLFFNQKIIQPKDTFIQLILRINFIALMELDYNNLLILFNAERRCLNYRGFCDWISCYFFAWFSAFHWSRLLENGLGFDFLFG